MYPRRYPLWEDPEIEDWRDDYPDDYSRLCFPLAAIGALGIVGALAYCRPRYGCYPYGCFPYRSCSPTYICYPRRA